MDDHTFAPPRSPMGPWSLVASAERRALDPQRYLTSVLAKTSTAPAQELGQFLPDVWNREDAAKPSPTVH